MAKFPIIKYVDVNGRNVPFSYPTHELKDGNYAKTGENNPLPTRDSDLKTELELIKQQQQQILERLDNPIDTQLTGSNVEKGKPIFTTVVEEYKLETLLDGEVLESNEQKNFYLGATNEKGIYLFISADKPNWTLRGRTLFGRLNHETTFPSYNNHDKSYSTSEPAIAFLLGIRPNAQGLEDPKNLDEARALRMPISSDEYALIKNNNEELNTFTVKVLRVW